MSSKRLNRPAANFHYPMQEAVSPSKTLASGQMLKKQVVSSKGRQSVKPQGNDEAWKDALPAYQFQGKRQKKVKLPTRDDSLLGGFANLGSSHMNVQSAKSYMEAKEAAEQQKREAENKRNAEFNPFFGLMDD